jgi:hypothetical protein
MRTCRSPQPPRRTVRGRSASPADTVAIAADIVPSTVRSLVALADTITTGVTTVRARASVRKPIVSGRAATSAMPRGTNSPAPSSRAAKPVRNGAAVASAVAAAVGAQPS